MGARRTVVGCSAGLRRTFVDAGIGVVGDGCGGVVSDADQRAVVGGGDVGVGVSYVGCAAGASGIVGGSVGGG